MATVTSRWDTSTYRRDILKDGAIRVLFNNSLKDTPVLYKELVKEEKVKDWIDFERSWTGLGLASEIVEGQNIPLDSPIFGNQKIYTQRIWGSGFRMTKVMNRFNKHQLFEKLAKNLGKVMRETKDVEVHVMFNNLTSTTLTCSTGFDSMAIANNAHTGLASGTADNYDNYLAAALSLSGLESARYYFATLLDDRGLHRGGKATHLVFNPALWPTVNEILKSNLKPFETSNTTNIHKGSLTPYEDFRLSSTTTWFVIDKDSDIYDFKVKTAQEPELVTKDAPDSTGDRLCLADQYFTYGWGDPRCLYAGRT